MNALDFAQDEIQRRSTLWEALKRTAQMDGKVGVADIRGHRVYLGQAGIFKDVATTRSAISPKGIAVSFRHNHTSYDDELSDGG